MGSWELMVVSLSFMSVMFSHDPDKLHIGTGLGDDGVSLTLSRSLLFSSLLFLQVDNRPCSRLPSTCFPYATMAASFLRAVMLLRPSSFPTLPELTVIISIRGVREEIGSRDEETGREEVKGKLLSLTHTHPYRFHPNKTP